MPLRRTSVFGIALLAASVATALPALRAQGAERATTGIPAELTTLARAYPDQIRAATADGLVLNSGETIPFENGHEAEPYEERLAHASLKDQMSMRYPAGANYAPPRDENDPGRLRDLPFFQAMYGASEGEVRRQLVPVRWLGREDLLITSVNGVDKALARVSAALMRLPAKRVACAYPSAGTFSYRIVAGTNYLSAHSFGIAIDLNLTCSDYWYWDQQRGADGSFSYKNRMPLEIVTAFEHEGFIWGGKWAHYDTMHFEYRPELLPTR